VGIVFNPFTGQLQLWRYWGPIDALVLESGDALSTEASEPLHTNRTPRLVQLMLDSIA
jgi:hypothetical protein